MTRFRLPFALVVLCSAILPIRAQIDDWHSLDRLAQGTPISVVKRIRETFDFVRATDAELICARSIDGRTHVFRREEVQEVRLEQPEHNHMIVGALAGAAVGAGIGFLVGGASSDPESRAYARIYGAPIGAVVGGLVGHAIHRHGEVIYRRP